MDEQSIPDPELDNDPVLDDDMSDVATPDEMAEMPLIDLTDADDLNAIDELADPEVLSYPGAAEDNPDRWQEDPLVNEEPLAGDPGTLSDQTLRDETAEDRFAAGNSQIPPEVPTLGEAAGDVDFDDPTAADEEDGSDDPAHLGGAPLAGFNPGDPEL